MGRPAAMTKIGERRVHTVRGRGGNLKFRALRLDSGNFSWGTEVCTRKVRVLDVTYNALVKIPPPNLAKIEIREAPKPKATNASIISLFPTFNSNNI